MEDTEYVLDTETSYVEGKGVVSDEASEDTDVQFQAGIGFSAFNVPDVVVPGERFTVSGKAFLDCVVSITPVATRVKIEIPELGEERMVNTGKLSCGNGNTFSESFIAPTDTGTEVTVQVTGQVNPPGPLTGYVGRGSKTATVGVVTEGEKRQQQAASYAPWIAGGGGAGYLAARRTGVDTTTGIAAGAALGAGARRYTGGDIPTPGDFAPGPFEAVAYAALLGTGAWLLTSTQDVTGIGEDEQVSVLSRARRGVSRARDRVSSRIQPSSGGRS